MEKNQEARKLAARFDKLAAAGLVDVKFYVKNPSAVSAETVYREVNNLYDAVDANKHRPLNFGDKRA